MRRMIFRKSVLYIIILLGLCILDAQEREEHTIFRGVYLGQKLPDYRLEAFVEDLFSAWNDYGFHLRSSIFFSADNKTLYFSNGTLPAVAGRSCSIWSMRQKGYSWTDPEVVPFSSDYYDKMVFCSPEGEIVHFVSTRPRNERGAPQEFDIWSVGYDGRGWSRPQKFSWPINSAYNDIGGMMTRDGVMYLSSDRPGGKGGFDIYYTHLGKPESTELVNFGGAMNTLADEFVVFVAPEATFLILYRNDKQHKMNSGLYISYCDENGAWTTPKSMGDQINALGCSEASISPDGNYLFLFSSGNGIYWLRTDIIDYLRNENLDIADELLSVFSGKGMSETLDLYHELKERHARYIDIDEDLMNQMAYQFIYAGLLDDAIVLLQIITALFPDSWNAYDSLGEAYLKAHRVESAKHSYEKSLELNPDNSNAANALEHIESLHRH
jgi:hypothetical protein